MQRRKVLLLAVVLGGLAFAYGAVDADGPGGVWLPWVMAGVDWPLPTATATATETPTVTPTGTPTLTATPSATPSPTATATVAPVADVRIVTIDADDEYVVVRNVGTAAQALAGWEIQSADGATCALLASQVFHFPAGYVLAAGGEVRVTSGSGAADNPPAVLRWTLQNIWANGGDRGELRDDAGHVVSSFRYGSCR